MKHKDMVDNDIKVALTNLHDDNDVHEYLKSVGIRATMRFRGNSLAYYVNAAMSGYIGLLAMEYGLDDDEILSLKASNIFDFTSSLHDKNLISVWLKANPFCTNIRLLSVVAGEEVVEE